MPLSFKDVAEIMKIIDSSNCEELVLEAEGVRLMVRRGGTSDSQIQPVTEPAQGSPASPVPPSAKQAAPMKSEFANAPQGELPADAFIEKAPMVGTFYSRPSPEESQFVEVGTKVSPGDPLCMIEVMKLYTTISASVEGEIDAILVEDDTLVEFDQPLFIIRP